MWMIRVLNSTLEDGALSHWLGSDPNPAAQASSLPHSYSQNPSAFLCARKLIEATSGCHPLFHTVCSSTVTTFCRTHQMPSKALFPWESGCFLESWHKLAKVSGPLRTGETLSSFHTWFSAMGVIFFRYHARGFSHRSSH